MIRNRRKARRVNVFLSTYNICGQSQQELTVKWTNQMSKKIRVGDAKQEQTCAKKSRFVVILLLIDRLSLRFHFTNHILFVCLRLATAITTFVCFDRELEEKASFKPQLKSAVRESPLDFCRFWKFFKVTTGDVCLVDKQRQTPFGTIFPASLPFVFKKNTYVTFNFRWEISLVA